MYKKSIEQLDLLIKKQMTIEDRPANLISLVEENLTLKTNIKALKGQYQDSMISLHDTVLQVESLKKDYQAC
jgi:hypothetical protein